MKIVPSHRRPPPSSLSPLTRKDQDPPTGRRSGRGDLQGGTYTPLPLCPAGETADPPPPRAARRPAAPVCARHLRGALVCRAFAASCGSAAPRAARLRYKGQRVLAAAGTDEIFGRFGGGCFRDTIFFPFSFGQVVIGFATGPGTGFSAGFQSDALPLTYESNFGRPIDS